MRIISPTKLQKKKLMEMILKLFPVYGYIHIFKNGNISMSKSFWHYIFFPHKTKRSNVSEMCTLLIPERLQETYDKTFKDDNVAIYNRAYNIYSHSVIELLHKRSSTVIDYLHTEYYHIKYKIQKVYCAENNILPETSYSMRELLLTPLKRNSLVLSRLSNTYIKQTLKYWINQNSNFNHPKMLSNYLNLWFNKEIKEKLEQYYKINISIG